MPLITNTEHNANVETAQILEGRTVVLRAGDESVVVVGSLRHTRCHLTVPKLTKQAHIDGGSEEEIDIIACGQLRNLVFKTRKERYLRIPVVEEALTDRKHIDEDLLEVGPATRDVQTRLQVNVFRPGIFPVGEHIIDITANVKTKNRRVRQQVVGNIRGAIGNTDTIVNKLGLDR